MGSSNKTYVLVPRQAAQWRARGDLGNGSTPMAEPYLIDSFCRAFRTQTVSGSHCCVLNRLALLDFSKGRPGHPGQTSRAEREAD